MSVLNRFRSIFVIAIKRILSQPWMALASMLGMILAISLTMSVPLYASSVYNRIFLQAVGGRQNPADVQARPPFSFLFAYDGSSGDNLQWQDIERVDTFLQSQASSSIQLPMRMFSHYYATIPLAIFPTSVEAFPDNQKPLIWSSIITLSDVEEYIHILEGTFSKTGIDGPIEVLISDAMAINLGLQVGENYTLFARNQVVDGARATLSIPVLISGVYQAKDPNSDYWVMHPELFEERLLVPDETFKLRVSPLLNNEIYSAFWYLLADGSSVRPEMAMQLAGRIQYLHRQAEQRLPKLRLSISPVDALLAYQRSANLLTVLLFAFSVPIFGLLLAFIVMTSSMTVERQRNEIAVLRSRGAMTAQLIGIATVESLILGGLALAISLPASAAIAFAMGSTRSFLDFSGNSLNSADRMLENLSLNTLYFGVGAITLAIVARLLPTFSAASDNIVAYKRERGRSLRAPLWQRMWLDVLLLIPAGYGIYLLRRQGSIDAFDASSRGDPFSNPLLILVPALAIFAFSLFFLRLLPFFMTAITWVTARTNSVGLMMAARHLARSPNTYSMPLVLLILTLSLSAFTATLAGTLDNHMHDQIYYKIGADANFLDLGDSPEAESTGRSGAPAPTAESSPGETQPGWFFLPVTDYLKLPNIVEATRVGRYSATALFGSRYESGHILGIDRYNLIKVAFWRSDFASESLGELMNRLGAVPDGLLVPEDFMTRNSLSQNELVTLRVLNESKTTDVDFHVVGTFKLFPTYYPGDEPLLIGNLDYIFQSAGGEYPYDVWLKANGPVDLDGLRRTSWMEIGARTSKWAEPVSLINAEQARPERQGLFGVLSVGFGAAALLTVLGFLLYAQISYQRRFVELGVLRAIGLSAGQMTSFLAAELAFLILTGGAIGTWLGVWISNLFIPYLQIGGSDASAKIPPYVVYVAWPAIIRVYLLFGVLFVVALVGLVILLRRMKIFQAIKMGENV